MLQRGSARLLGDRYASTGVITVLTLLTVIIAFVLWWQESEGIRAKKWVVHTYNVRGHIRLLYDKVKDIETSSLGYSISGDKYYLELYLQAQKDSAKGIPFQASQRNATSAGLAPRSASGDISDGTIFANRGYSINEELRILRWMTSDNPVQQANLDEMQGAINALLEDVAADMARRKKSGVGAIANPDIKSSSVLIQRVQHIAGIMEAEEERLLVARIASDKQKAQQKTWIISVCILLFYISMAYAIWLYQHMIKRASKKLEAVVDHALDGIITINSQGVIESFNPACRRMFGYDEKDVVGQNVNILMPEPYHSAHNGYLHAYRKSGEARIIGSAGREVVGRRKNGDIFPMDLSISVFALGDGKHFSGTMRDISDRKAAEAELANYMNALEHSNNELDEFAYIVSHDLKEPLRGIFNNVQFLEEDYKDKLDAAATGRLQRLVYLTQRMESLINDLLYYSRLGRQDLAIMPADLNAAIAEISGMMETTLAEQKATIRLASPLPQIICDKTRVTEIFRNLVTNAVKYNNRDIKTVEIGYLEEVPMQDGSSEKQVFYVRDNGVGIAPEFHEDIFHIFKRLNPEEDSKKGTGVGLTFVRKIVERHGGKIWLESEIGAGTTFYFTLGTANR